MSDTYAAANNRPLYAARISIPRFGAWHADIAVDGEEPLANRVTLSLGGVKFSAAVRRQGLSIGNVYARLVGGAGGLKNVAPAQGYHSVPFSVPLQDMLTFAGERVSPSSSPKVTTYLLNSFSRTAGPVGRSISNLLDVSPVESSWRVLYDGSVWVGEESWSTAQVDYELLSYDAELGRYEVYSERPDWMPGTVVTGLRVSSVEHVLRDSVLRTWVWTE